MKLGDTELSRAWGDEVVDSDTDICSYLSNLGIIYSGDTFKVLYLGKGFNLDVLKHQRDCIMGIGTHFGHDTDLLAFQP